MGNNSNLINEKYKTPAKIMRVLTTGGNKDRTGRIHNPETRRITIPGGHKKTLQQGDFASKRARNMLDAANLAKAYRRKNLGMKIQKHLESILIESLNRLLMEARGDTLAARYEKKTGRPFPEDLNVPERGKKAGQRIKAAVRIARGTKGK